MDDAKSAQTWNGFRLSRPVALLMACAVGFSQPGCSLFVMAGKMFFGDPAATSTFTQSTRVDLVKEGKRILVICSTPDAVKTNFPSVDFDLLDGVTRRLKVRGIKVVDPDNVATWLDDHGGRWNDIVELRHFRRLRRPHGSQQFTCRKAVDPLGGSRRANSSTASATDLRASSLRSDGP
jgi:hypothetical protein